MNRSAWLAVSLGVLIAVGALSAAGKRPWLKPPVDEISIAVLYPGTTDLHWTNFVEGVRLAAQEVGLTVEEDDEKHECVVNARPQPVRFRWYHDVGLRAIQRRVEELSASPKPPLAFVGANNSCLTEAAARALAKSKSPRRPLFLMTSATANHLVNLNPGRSFRFGFQNAYQSRVVVERLRDYYRERQVPAPAPRIILVQVLDDPFSVDLAKNFHDELLRTFSPELVTFHSAASSSGWVLRTSTGGFDAPTDEEWRLAREIVAQTTSTPDKEWVLVMPIGSAQYRRLAVAVDQCLRETVDAPVARRVRERMVVLAGDSLNYFTFRDTNVSHVFADETLGPVIFFAHLNPLDPDLRSVPNRQRPTRALNRLVVRTLLDVLPQAGRSPTPTRLAEILAEYKAPDEAESLFRQGERHLGGGAVMALPLPSEGRFEMVMPPAWTLAASGPSASNPPPKSP